jgi:hypothetical protein
VSEPELVLKDPYMEDAVNKFYEFDNVNNAPRLPSEMDEGM